MESKKILELHFNLGCPDYVKQASHSNKYCLNKTVSPQPTSQDRVMLLFRENGFPVLCKRSYWGLLPLDIAINILHQRMSVVDGHYSYSKFCMFFLPPVNTLPVSCHCTKVGERTQVSDIQIYIRIFIVSEQ